MNKYTVTLSGNKMTTPGVSLTTHAEKLHEAAHVTVSDAGALRGYNKDNELVWAYPQGEWIRFVKND